MNPNNDNTQSGLLPYGGRPGGGCGDGVSLLLLAFALMILASCKTRQSVEMSTDTLSIHSLSIKDSLYSEFNLIFDQMDIWVQEAPSQPPLNRMAALSLEGERGESLRKQGVYISISKGSIGNNCTKVEDSKVNDSTRITKQEVIKPVRTPPKISTYIIPLAVILCFVCLIIRNRSRKTS